MAFYLQTVKEIVQRQYAAGNSYPPCFRLTSCVDKQRISNSPAEDSVNTAVAVPGNILTPIVSKLKKTTVCSPLWSPLPALN